MLFVRALRALLIYDLLNTFCRFDTICSTVTGWNVANRLADQNMVIRVCEAVNYACVCYPKRALCLQRSFVTTYLLRKNGVQAQLVIGTQKLPFKAHAWVEVEGAAVNERTNVHATYAVWERC
jgi:hypothetical protein